MGHVFVTQGDLTRLWCDAWLMPTGPRCFIVDYWFREEVIEAMGDALAPAAYSHLVPSIEIPTAYSAGKLRTFRFDTYPGADDGPRPWLTNVGGNQAREPQWYLEAVEQFVRKACVAGARVTKRSKPLLGLPLVGTGAGGQWFQKAEMTRALLPLLHRLADELDVDLALVTYDDEAFAAAQVVRRNLRCEWTELTAAHRDHAATLARHALAGDLVLFMGAGASMGAGLPSWQGLLDDLAEVAGLSADEVETMSSLPATDQARILEDALGGRSELVAAIRSRLDVPNVALTHTFCARLPTETSVTLNYDRLFELASEAQGHTIHVIPNRGKGQSSRTLLKLHGCISREADIVLTREDYLRYGDRRSALAGFVQALLITHHMLFVGFGLADDNFHRIIDDVRKVLGDPDEETGTTVGTVLTLLPELLRDRLWSDDFDIVPMFDDPKASLADAARRLEIFLDYVVFLTGQRPTYLLNPTYDGLLTDRERDFRNEVAELARNTAHLGDSPLGIELRAFLKRLGAHDGS